MAKNLVIFRTNKEEDKTQVVGQIRDDKSVPQLSQIVNQVTGEKPTSAVKTSTSTTFNTPTYKVDLVDKDIFNKSNIPA